MAGHFLKKKKMYNMASKLPRIMIFDHVSIFE
jgi:hypothetical protein